MGALAGATAIYAKVKSSNKFFDTRYHLGVGKDNINEGNICFHLAYAWSTFRHIRVINSSVPALPRPEEVLYPIFPGEHRLLPPPPPHLLADVDILLLLHLNKIHAMFPRPRGLAPAADEHKHADGHDEQPVAHVARLGPAGGAVAAAAVVLPVPALPVLPGGVVGGGAGLGAPGPVGLAVGRVGHLGGAAPARAVQVVGAPLGRVREDVVGGDDEAVAL